MQTVVVPGRRSKVTDSPHEELGVPQDAVGHRLQRGNTKTVYMKYCDVHSTHIQYKTILY